MNVSYGFTSREKQKLLSSIRPIEYFLLHFAVLHFSNSLPLLCPRGREEGAKVWGA